MKLGQLEGVEPWKAGQGVPAGVYTARIDEITEGKSTNGFDQLEIEWTVVGGEYDGATKKDWLTITEATRGKVVALIQAVGIEITPGDFVLDVPGLKGKVAEIVVRNEPKWNEPGKLIPRVSGYGPASDVPAASGATPKATRDDVPFARPIMPDLEHGLQARRDLFVKGPETF